LGSLTGRNHIPPRSQGARSQISLAMALSTVKDRSGGQPTGRPDNGQIGTTSPSRAAALLYRLALSGRQNWATKYPRIGLNVMASHAAPGGSRSRVGGFAVTGVDGTKAEGNWPLSAYRPISTWQPAGGSPVARNARYTAGGTRSPGPPNSSDMSADFATHLAIRRWPSGSKVCGRPSNKGTSTRGAGFSNV
jgi:hypothetical protein